MSLLKKIMVNPSYNLIKVAARWNDYNEPPGFKSSVCSRCICIVAFPVGLLETSIKGVVGVVAKTVQVCCLGKINVNKFTKPFSRSLLTTISSIMMGIFNPVEAHEIARKCEQIPFGNTPWKERIHIRNIDNTKFYQIVENVIYLNSKCRTRFDIKTRLWIALLVPVSIYYGVKNSLIQSYQLGTIVFRENKIRACGNIRNNQRQIIHNLYASLFAPYDLYVNINKNTDWFRNK